MQVTIRECPYFRIVLSLIATLVPVDLVAQEGEGMGLEESVGALQENGTGENQSPQTEGSQADQIQKLWQEIEALKQQLQQQTSEQTPPPAVDLSDESVPLYANGEGSPWTRPWYSRFDLWGFGAAGFVATGDDGARPKGSFLVTGSSLFVEAHPWEDVSFLFEIEATRAGQPDGFNIDHRELYAHFRNVLKHWGDDLLGIKIGYVDIPFGEEYLQTDPPDNPLITHSAVLPYGFDEGIVLYGRAAELGWIFSVTDGSFEEGFDDHWDKATSLKLYGNPLGNLYLSLSLMRNGKSVGSKLCFNGSYLQPVGFWHPSSAGTSSSERIDDALLYEADAKISFGDWGYVSLAFGQAYIDDEDSTFDRDFLWFIVEALFNITDTLYTAVRYSEIGTYSSSEGYHFNGGFTAEADKTLGYDVRRSQRISAGLGFRPAPPILIKGELGYDFFDVIDASPIQTSDDDRLHGGLEVVVSF